MMYTFSGLKKELMSLSNQFNFRFSDANPGNWRTAQLKNGGVQVQTINPGSTAVPSLIGMGLKDALYVLESSGMKVQVNGKGKVMNQSIAAGTPVVKGQQIVLYLN